MNSDHEVVIVGLGPTGATLANILAGYGIDVLVLEREAAVSSLPRAVHFDDEAMRVFQSIGLADGIGRDARVNVGTKFVDRHQDLLLDWPRPQIWAAWLVSQLQVPSAGSGSRAEPRHCGLHERHAVSCRPCHCGSGSW